MKVIADVEANGLLPTVSKLWCAVTKNIETGEVRSFNLTDHNDVHAFKEQAKYITKWVGHNFVGYDRHVIKKFTGVTIPLDNILDTMILSMMAHPERQFKHSLEAWGERLGFGKGDFQDFSQYSPAMLEYCKTDVELTHKVLTRLIRELAQTSKAAVRLEHKMSEILQVQMDNGFAVNELLIQELMIQTEQKAKELEVQIIQDFKPKIKFLREYTPHLVKDGSRLSLPSCGSAPMEYLHEGGSYSSIQYVPFNIGSPTQVNERLKGHWSPVQRTKAGQGWSLSEVNFSTIKDSAPRSALLIREYMINMSRFRTFRTWFQAVQEDGRIHGRVWSIGCWTHRMRHDNPNTANIPATIARDGTVAYLGKEARECWTVSDPERYRLLGTDASGIQLRVLAHHINNPIYTDIVVSGDIHAKNSEWLGVKGLPRERAKTWVYAWLLGAGTALQADTLGCSHAEAKEAEANIINNAPGFREFIARKEFIARQGWFIGIDGRRVEAPSDHLVLTALLQSGEQAIMKVANCIWYKNANDANIEFKQVATVHDEWQTEVLWEYAERLGIIQVQSLKAAGVYLKLNVPLAGNFNIGETWVDTH